MHAYINPKRLPENRVQGPISRRPGYTSDVRRWHSVNGILSPNCKTIFPGRGTCPVWVPADAPRPVGCAPSSSPVTLRLCSPTRTNSEREISSVARCTPLDSLTSDLHPIRKKPKRDAGFDDILPCRNHADRSQLCRTGNEKKKRRRRSTRHAAGGLLWLAATAVAHQGLFSVLRHHRAARKPRLTRAKRTTARRRRPPRRAAPPRASPRLALQQRTRTRTHAPALAPRERSNPPSEFRTGSQKVPARTANRFDHRRWRFLQRHQRQWLI